MTLLLMIVSGYLFYGLYDGKRTCRFVVHVRILPNDEISNGIFLVKGVDQIPDLGVFPNKRPLHLRDDNGLIFDKTNNVFYRFPFNRIFIHDPPIKLLHLHPVCFGPERQLTNRHSSFPIIYLRG